MSLTLRIENMANLPDGGPLSYTLTGQRGADIGRDPHLDWTLPDPTRHVSGTHCEIRYQDGGYMLRDVSSNGTFLNGSEHRIQSPYRLKTGDRLAIGDYIVAVDVSGEQVTPDPTFHAGPPPAFQDLWSVDGAAPPMDPREFRPPSDARPVKPDFLEWAVDVPNAPGMGFVARPVGQAPATAQPDMWSPPPEAAPAVPKPRRSIWVSPEPSGPWGAGAATSPSAEPLPAPVPHEPTPPAVGFEARPSDAAPAPEPAHAPQPSPAFPAETAPVLREAVPPTPEPAPVYREPPQPAAEAAPPPQPVPAFRDTPPPPPPAPIRRDPPPPQPAPASAAPQHAEVSREPPTPPPPPRTDLVDRFARGAGIPAHAIHAQDPGAIMERLGRVLLQVTGSVKQLLDARSQSKRLAGSSSHTMIAALDNNPLKFSPTAADALRIMLGEQSTSYLDAETAFKQSFDDLKTHQVKVLSAMQMALEKLVEDLDPKKIEETLGERKGPGSWVGLHRAQLWTVYEQRWKSKKSRHGGGLRELFMEYFAECYDQVTPGPPK